VAIAEPGCEDERSGQLRHVASDVAVSSVEYLPGAHGVHTDVPRTDLNVPETHAVQL